MAPAKTRPTVPSSRAAPGRAAPPIARPRAIGRAIGIWETALPHVAGARTRARGRGWRRPRFAYYEDPIPMPIASTIAPPTVTTSSDERIETSRKRLRTHAITNSSTATTQPATISALWTLEIRNGSV